MSIIIPSRLPAHSALKAEGLSVFRSASIKDMRNKPLRIGLLNLMPDKVKTETQIARLLGSNPYPVAMPLVRLSEHQYKNTSSEHLSEFYQPFADIMSEGLDGLIITSAPVEHLEFSDVRYWRELQEIMDWAATNVLSTIGICWGGMALAYHHYGIQKHSLKTKSFGCFAHRLECQISPYLCGLSDNALVPVSRWSELKQHDIGNHLDLQTLQTGRSGGPGIVNDSRNRALYVLNHYEYDFDTLSSEYFRDVASNIKIQIPENYFPRNDTEREPVNSWQCNARILYTNWLNQIYLRKKEKRLDQPCAARVRNKYIDRVKIA